MSICTHGYPTFLCQDGPEEAFRSAYDFAVDSALPEEDERFAAWVASAVSNYQSGDNGALMDRWLACF